MQDPELVLAALLEGTITAEQLSELLTDRELLELQQVLMQAHLHSISPTPVPHNCTLH